MKHARRITHLLHAWPPHAPQDDTAHVVVHVRGEERLHREITELKARGLSKVCVVPVGVDRHEWWA
jgi:hypothetical protein